MNLLRTFVAIQVPVEKTLQEVWAELKGKVDVSQVKWVDTQALHLTLFFLGDTPEGDLGNIGNDLKQALKDKLRFNLEIKGLGIFGSPTNPKVIWVGVDRSPNLSELKREVSRVLFNYGFIDEQRAFNPHITLGRVINISNPQALIKALHGYNDFHFQLSVVTSIVHFKSDLRPTGPIYTPISEVKLA